MIFPFLLILLLEVFWIVWYNEEKTGGVNSHDMLWDR